MTRPQTRGLCSYSSNCVPGPVSLTVELPRFIALFGQGNTIFEKLTNCLKAKFGNGALKWPPRMAIKPLRLLFFSWIKSLVYVNNVRKVAGQHRTQNYWYFGRFAQAHFRGGHIVFNK